MTKMSRLTCLSLRQVMDRQLANDARNICDAKGDYAVSLRVIADCATSLFNAKVVDGLVGGDEFERIATGQLVQALKLIGAQI